MESEAQRDPRHPSSMLRLAAILFWAAGVLTLLSVVAALLPMAAEPDIGSLFTMLPGLVAAGSMCTAGYLIRKRRVVGAVLAAGALIILVFAMSGLIAQILVGTGILALVLALLARSELT